MSFSESLDRYFKITERGSTIQTEMRAGLTSFLTLSYILLVHPQVMAKSGMEARDVVTATCISSGLATLLVALVGNLPLVMAPGLGLSAYFTYGLVLANGSDITWEQALGCVLVAGVLMCFLTVTLLVEWTMNRVPGYMKTSTIVGIGLLLAGIGFESSGLIVNGEVGELFVKESWTVWLALGGLMGTALMKHHDVKGAIVIGVVAVAVIYWTVANKWPATVMEVPALNQTAGKLEVSGMNPAEGVPAVATFLLVALFDGSGCLIALAMHAKLVPDISQPVPGGFWALLACGLGTVLAGLTGCSPIIIAIEGTAGILDGGRTGLTALTAAALFLLSLFFAPLFGAVPECASAGVLMMIGSFMMAGVKELDWEKITVALPCFLVILIMPLSHSISNGIWFGGGAAIFFAVLDPEVAYAPDPRPTAPLPSAPLTRAGRAEQTWRGLVGAVRGGEREDGALGGKRGNGQGDIKLGPSGSVRGWGVDRQEEDSEELEGLLQPNGGQSIASNAAWE